MKIAVYGYGVMGKGIVQALSAVSSVEQISWMGRDKAKLEESKAFIEEQILQTARRKKYTTEQTEETLGKVNTHFELSDLKGFDFVFEVVAEDPAVKKSVLSELSRNASDEAIVATSTSSLSITDLSKSVSSPERFLGIHFFNPAHIVKLIEIIPGVRTGEKFLNRTLEMVSAINKAHVVVNETPGFVVNRLLIPMINEAVHLVAEGVASPKNIDDAMRMGANHPMGPLALADLIGLDVVLNILEMLHGQTGDPKYRPHYMLRKKVWGGQLGRKVGVGFYDYQSQN